MRGAEGLLGVANVNSDPAAPLYQAYWERWKRASSLRACSGDYSDGLYCRASELSFTSYAPMFADAVLAYAYAIEALQATSVGAEVCHTAAPTLD